MRLRITQFERTILTPADAAQLVASGCGCADSGGSYAIADPGAPASAVTWSGVIGVENELTGDGRFIESNALNWENVPIPLRYAPEDNGGHQGAQVVGRILTITRGDGGQILATGDFDMASPLGPEAARVVENGTSDGISMDLDSVSFEIRVARDILQEEQQVEDEGPADAAEDNPTDDEGRVVVIEIAADDEIMALTDARIRAATIVAIPAFASARISLDAPVPTDIPAGAAAAAAATIVAGSAPMEPPADWFIDPHLSGPTPLTVTEDGRVFGHLAVWGTCHTAYSGQCVEPPHSPSGYAYFRTGAVLTADGSEVPVGSITLDTLHAGRSLSAADTLAHYEHTGRAVADVSAGEDVYGIWVAGALRPEVKPESVRALRASPLSGDWRRIGSGLELVAALAVNSPGFPIPRPQGLVASGGVIVSLVASGMVAPYTLPADTGLSAEDLSWLKRLAARERSRVATEAEALAERVRSTRASVLARRAGVR